MRGLSKTEHMLSEPHFNFNEFNLHSSATNVNYNTHSTGVLLGTVHIEFDHGGFIKFLTSLKIDQKLIKEA